MAQPALIIECNDKAAQILDALVETGFWGSSREVCAQRLLELKLHEMSVGLLTALLKAGGEGGEKK